MRNRIYASFCRLFDRRVSAIGLEVFRITFFAVLLRDVIHLYEYRHLIFDIVPHIRNYELILFPALTLWIISLISLILGFYTRVALILNYVFCIVFIANITSYEYHMYFVYVSVSFVAMFVPLGKTLSLDRIIHAVKSRNPTKFIEPPGVSKFYYILLVFTGIALVYWDSLFYKYASSLWLKGLGVWLPSSIPQIISTDITPLLNIKWLMLFMGYLTLAFETVFIFLFWKKKMRLPFFVIGIVLHLGIFIIYPIPYFGLGVMALYLLLLPLCTWSKIAAFFRTRKEPIPVSYKVDSLPAARMVAVLKAVDFRKIFRFTESNPDDPAAYFEVQTHKGQFQNTEGFRKCLRMTLPGTLLSICFSFLGTFERFKTEQHLTSIPAASLPENKKAKIYRIQRAIAFAGLLALFMAQHVFIYGSTLIWKLRPELPEDRLKIDTWIHGNTFRVKPVLSKYFGFKSHAVFIDSHFEGFDHNLSLEYVGENGNQMLPMTTENGLCGEYQIGPTWAKWSFRINSPIVSPVLLDNGIEIFTAFWLHENDIPVDGSKFELIMKKNRVPQDWEHNFLKEQLEQPWQTIGWYHWENQKLVQDSLYWDLIHD